MSTGKGKKRIKNQPVLYDGLKKQRAVWLTSVAWEKAQSVAVRLGVSTSEYLEQLIRLDGD
ncbi:hypothetical protein NIES4073_28960 [Kalymmatonema gypsitolerans NIES-4073]|nr:hypothetical protein NIES4073_28960 [Scytonema sp. NIES-4073]